MASQPRLDEGVTLMFRFLQSMRDGVLADSYNKEQRYYSKFSEWVDQLPYDNRSEEVLLAIFAAQASGWHIDVGKELLRSDRDREPQATELSDIEQIDFESLHQCVTDDTTHDGGGFNARSLDTALPSAQGLTLSQKLVKNPESIHSQMNSLTFPFQKAEYRMRKLKDTEGINKKQARDEAFKGLLETFEGVTKFGRLRAFDFLEGVVRCSGYNNVYPSHIQFPYVNSRGPALMIQLMNGLPPDKSSISDEYEKRVNEQLGLIEKFARKCLGADDLQATFGIETALCCAKIELDKGPNRSWVTAELPPRITEGYRVPSDNHCEEFARYAHERLDGRK